MDEFLRLLNSLGHLHEVIIHMLLLFEVDRVFKQTELFSQLVNFIMCSLVDHAEQALLHSVLHAAFVQLNSRFNHLDFFVSFLVNLNKCSHRQGVIWSILSFQCFSLGYHCCRLLSLTFPAAFPTSIISII